MLLRYSWRFVHVVICSCLPPCLLACPSTIKIARWMAQNNDQPRSLHRRYWLASVSMKVSNFRSSILCQICDNIIGAWWAFFRHNPATWKSCVGATWKPQSSKGMWRKLYKDNYGKLDPPTPVDAAGKPLVKKPEPLGTNIGWFCFGGFALRCIVFI